MQTAFLADPVSKEHNPGAGHPESPARFDAAVKGLAGLKLTAAGPRSASDDELALCHTRSYIGIARHDVEAGNRVLSTGDTDLSERSFDVALRAAGTCLSAIDRV